MELLILTPNGIAFEGECDELYLPTTRGPLGIMRGYTPVVGELKPTGVAKITSFGKSRFFALWHGAVEVKPDDKIVVLSETALEADSEEEALELIKGRPLTIDKDEEDVKVASAKLKQ
jgi:F-type H+-transporting ATPase subunit epsilon